MKRVNLQRSTPQLARPANSRRPQSLLLPMRCLHQGGREGWHREANPVVGDVGVRRHVHLRHSVQDVVYVVAEVQHGIGDDSLGGSDAGREQGQRGGQRQGRL